MLAHISLTKFVCMHANSLQILNDAEIMMTTEISAHIDLGPLILKLFCVFLLGPALFST